MEKIMTALRDGSIVEDPRLGRIIEFDERSRNYPIRTLLEARKPRAYTYRNYLRLDQGSTDGSCVGCGFTHELAAWPAEVPDLDYRFAKEKVYWEAQRNDQWAGGSYPGASPRMDGTSLLAGVKVIQTLGYCDEYRWAFTLQDLILGVGYHGPAVVGTNWYEGMFTPDTSGRVRPTGRVAGGHCWLIDQVIPKKEMFGALNSWGTKWGIKSRFYITFADMDKLRKEQGEAVFLIKRHKVPHPA
jgi:hypothetical protein